MSQCDNCIFYNYDDITQDYFCDCDIDEDELIRMSTGPKDKGCPYFRDGDEYGIVRHQI